MQSVYCLSTNPLWTKSRERISSSEILLDIFRFAAHFILYLLVCVLPSINLSFLLCLAPTRLLSSPEPILFSSNNPHPNFPSCCFISFHLWSPFSRFISFRVHVLSPLCFLNNMSFVPPSHFLFIPPLLTPGHLLRDRLPSMCSSGPAVRHSDADSRPLLLHVPLLWQLWRRDAPAPEEERGLPAWPAGNAAVLHLTGHHVSMTHPQHTQRRTRATSL